MIELKDEISEKMLKTLGPIDESWSGVKLKPTSVYGIRRYLNNSALMSHIDKPDTHIIVTAQRQPQPQQQNNHNCS